MQNRPDQGRRVDVHDRTAAAVAFALRAVSAERSVAAEAVRLTLLTVVLVAVVLALRDAVAPPRPRDALLRALARPLVLMTCRPLHCGRRGRGWILKF